MVEHAEDLTQQQVDRNTTWDITLQGIAEPGKPERLLPLDYFCGTGRTHTPLKQVNDALTELFRLQDLAVEKNVDHWSKLDRSLLPEGWFMRTKKSSTGRTHNRNPKKSDQAAKEELVTKGLATKKNPPRPSKNGKSYYSECISDETDNDLYYKDDSEQGDPEDDDFGEDYFGPNNKERDHSVKDKTDRKLKKKEEARPCVGSRRKSKSRSNLDAAPDNVTADLVHIPAPIPPELVKNKHKVNSDEIPNTQHSPKRARPVSVQYNNIFRS